VAPCLGRLPLSRMRHGQNARIDCKYLGIHNQREMPQEAAPPERVQLAAQWPPLPKEPQEARPRTKERGSAPCPADRLCVSAPPRVDAIGGDHLGHFLLLGRSGLAPADALKQRHEIVGVRLPQKRQFYFPVGHACIHRLVVRSSTQEPLIGAKAVGQGSQHKSVINNLPRDASDHLMVRMNELIAPLL
jgi:hypothetical protein